MCVLDMDTHSYEPIHSVTKSGSGFYSVCIWLNIVKVSYFVSLLYCININYIRGVPGHLVKNLLEALYLHCDWWMLMWAGSILFSILPAYLPLIYPIRSKLGLRDVILSIIFSYCVWVPWKHAKWCANIMIFSDIIHMRCVLYACQLYIFMGLEATAAKRRSIFVEFLSNILSCCYQKVRCLAFLVDASCCFFIATYKALPAL